jgi:hypothetical protein
MNAQLAVTAFQLERIVGSARTARSHQLDKRRWCFLFEVGDSVILPALACRRPNAMPQRSD